MDYTKLSQITDSITASPVPNYHLKEVFYGTGVEVDGNQISWTTDLDDVVKELCYKHGIDIDDVSFDGTTFTGYPMFYSND